MSVVVVSAGVTADVEPIAIATTTTHIAHLTVGPAAPSVCLSSPKGG